ncbi:FAD-dependent oxidoreductase [Roseococcus sp. SYP-B2431]|uniref:FAD-dependent oxidoreductase n=1 Tax=Roseococcus sp. SYP-B2431 TaxID=2496640 RepID=UPI00103DD64C|nr:FAD-dependent oxidoreductase [Roseococcus sp. SYP-B2431]TCH98869.1 FAD-dependent oxidoreductase [Roseococcus sp. SYP-B2431]
METRPAALVLGAGIMGLCTAWGLLREGYSVRVVDQAPPPNPRGSSVDHHRLIRHAYGAQAGYMRMVDSAYAAWDELWADLGEVLHVPTGVLAIDEAGGEWLRESRAALRAEGRAVTDLSAPEVTARFPYLAGDGIAGAFWCPEGGVLLAERIVAALARHVVARGAVIETARAVRVDAAHASLVLEDGSRRSAEVLVVAAGPWIPRLLPSIGQRVTASRQVLVRLAPPPELAESFAGAPMIIDLSGGFYMVPPVAGTPLKIGDHSFSLEGDPDDPDRTPDPREAERILALARRRIPALDRFAHLGAATCFYDVEPEERFVVEKISRRAWVMSGFSGHGFKFGALLGRRLAEAIAKPELEAFLPAWAAGDEVMAA